MDEKRRCFGNGENKEFYAEYHDHEWGIPVYDDVRLFEMLILEGAQAGLAWETILKKRQGYRAVFHNFNIEKVANMKEAELQSACNDSRIIRNRLKIYATQNNAKVFMNIQNEYGTFSDYLWSYVDGKPIINHWQTFQDLPITTKQSDELSKDLKKRGMKFVGSTIIYAYMQAIGMVNDHLQTCWRYGK